MPTALVGLGDFFIVIAKGNSMIDIGIGKGNLLFTKWQNNFRG